MGKIIIAVIIVVILISITHPLISLEKVNVFVQDPASGAIEGIELHPFVVLYRAL